jgi:hypothetical protein
VFPDQLPRWCERLTGPLRLGDLPLGEPASAGLEGPEAGCYGKSTLAHYSTIPLCEELKDRIMGRAGSLRQSWTDMSEHVVHMAKGRDTKEAYDNIIGILGARKIEARTAFGIARNLALDPSSQRAACFSEIPLEHLDRLAARRIPGYPDGWHGIGFSKAIVSERGGGPVFYAYAGTPQAVAVRELIQRAKISQMSNDPIWRLTPLIEAPGVYNGSQYYFEWEREWRHVGDFVFDTTDVAFLVMPEKLHPVARAFFAEAYTENIGPAYFCPFLDITWPRDRILCALASGSVAAPLRLPEGYR